MPILELRVALTVDDFNKVVAFYRDGLGLEPGELWTDRGNGQIFAAGRATLEVFDHAHADSVDQLEVGRKVSGQIRFAFEVPDVRAALDHALKYGSTLVHEPVLTPWNHLNARILSPEGLQITLFQAMDYAVELAVPGDTDAVQALANAAYIKWVPIIGGDPMPMHADYPALIADGFVNLIRAGDALAAVLVIWQEGDALYIDNLAVAPSHQRRGIGDLLLNFAEQRARAMGLTKLSLKTNAKMESNQAYYGKRGYVEIRRESFGGDRVAVWMEKALLAT